MALAVEFKITDTDTDKAKSMLYILSDMLGDKAVPTEYKERIAKILSK